jgi:pimeloyl-ACP methyl ester carboxylesterase
MITLDGQRIDTAWWGERPDADLTLVLLHEGLGCIALWRDFPERLAQATGCPVFAYSRLGYGHSDPVPLPRPLDYMRAESRTILGRVLDQAGIGPCILIGHSDGASIAVIHAGSAGDARVRGVVLIAPHFFVEDIAITAIAAARDAYNQGTLRDRLARYHDHVDVAFRGWNDAWLDLDSAPSTCSTMSPASSCPSFSYRALPTPMAPNARCSPPRPTPRAPSKPLCWTPNTRPTSKPPPNPLL